MKSILIFGCLWMTSVCFGQADTISGAQTSGESVVFLKNNYRVLFQQNFEFGTTGLSNPYPVLTATPIHLSNPFMHGMFCTMQDKIESKSKWSPRFRLGSQNYTDWMEGKKEIYMRYWK